MNASSRRMSVMAGVAWVVAGGAGSWSSMFDSDDWELSYTIFTVALLVAACLTVMLAAAASQGTTRPALRRLGLIVGGLGVLSCGVGAWAVPLWTTLLGAGLAVLAWSSPGPARRAVAVLAGGQVAGVVVLIAGETAGIGRTDEWGNHPVAGIIGVAVIVAAAIAGLVMLADRGVAASGPRSAAAVAP